MEKLSIRQLRERCCQVLESVRLKNWSYIVTHYSHSVAVILPLSRYLELVEHRCPEPQGASQEPILALRRPEPLVVPDSLEMEALDELEEETEDYADETPLPYQQVFRRR